MSALREVKQALALDPNDENALALSARTEQAIKERQEDARIRTAVGAARRQFAAGDHRAALAALEALQPSSHPLVRPALDELRTALNQIEEQQRIETELQEQRRYVAGLFADLQTWLTGLTGTTSTAPATGAGGVQSIAALSSSTLVHVVDLHGNVYKPALPAATLVTTDGSGNQTGTVPAAGLVTLNSGDGIDVASPATDNGRLRWGWETNGVLARVRLAPPALPAGSPAPSLPQQFYRLTVVDTIWALLGNRTGEKVLGIPADDQTIPADVLPKVRDQIVIDYLADGPDTLAEASAVLARPSQNMILAVSPVLDTTMAVPTQVGVNAHWPAFPVPNGGAGFPSPPASAKDGITAEWTAGSDVVVTVAADKVPDGAHIRIYPQVYVTIPAITQEPSFLRGDGGAAIARAGQPTLVLLGNPFQLATGQPRPSPANLTMDIVVAPRSGARKMWGAVAVQVSAGPAPAPADPFSGTNGVTSMVTTFESIAPSPIFGVPDTITPPSTSCVRPDSASRRSRASRSSAAFPSSRPSSTTSVSTPRTRMRSPPATPLPAPAGFGG